MAAGSNTSMGDRQLWSSWAAKQSLKYSDSESEENDDDESKRIQTSGEEKKKYSDSMKLPRKDMSIFGLRPASEDLILVVCTLCNLHVKQQNFIYHRNNHHKEANDDDLTNHTSKHSVPKYLASNKSSQSAKNAYDSGRQCSRMSNNNNNSFCSASTTASSSSGTHQNSNLKSKTGAASGQGFPGSDNESYKRVRVKGGACNEEIYPSSNRKLPSSQQVLQNSVIGADGRYFPSAISNFSSNVQPTVELEQLPFVQNNGVKKRKGKKTPYDPDIHCGVLLENGQPCTRSLLHTCKGHLKAMRQEVPGRSKDFKTLLEELQRKHSLQKQYARRNEPSVVYLVPENVVQSPQTNNVPVIEILKVSSEESNHVPSPSPWQITGDAKPGSWEELQSTSLRNELFAESPQSPNHLEKIVPSNFQKIHNDGFSCAAVEVPVPVKVTSSSASICASEVLGKKQFNSACHNQRNSQNLIIQPCSPLQNTVLTATPNVPALVSSNVVTTVDSKSQLKFNSTQATEITGIVRGLPNLKDLSNCGFLKDSIDGDTGSDSTPAVAKRRPKPVSICTFGLRFVNKGMYTTCPKIRHIHTAFSKAAQKKCADPEPKLTENPAIKHQCGSDQLEHHITSSSFVAPPKAPSVVNSGDQAANAWPVYYKTPANQTPRTESKVKVSYPFSNWDPNYQQKNGMGLLDRSWSIAKSAEEVLPLKVSPFMNQPTSQPILTHANSGTNQVQPPKKKKKEGIWNPALSMDTSAHPVKETITNSLPELEPADVPLNNLVLAHFLPLQIPTSQQHGHINLVCGGGSNTSAVFLPSQNSAQAQDASALITNGSVSEYSSSSDHLWKQRNILSHKRIHPQGNSDSRSENECPKASSPVLAVQTPVSSSHTPSFQLSLGLKRPLGNAVVTASKINQPVTTMKSILVSSATVANDKQCRPKHHVARILPKDSPTAISLNRLVGTSCQILQIPSDILCKNGISSGDTTISFR